MKHIYPILNFRYANKLATIFSTECTLNQLLDLDEALGGRVLQMCGDNITEIVGREYNYRIRNIKKAQ